MREDRRSPIEDLSAIELIQFIRTNAWPGFDFGFVDSLEKQLQQKRRLSPKQAAALSRIYHRMRGD